MLENSHSIYKFEDTLFPPKITLQIKGKLFALNEPWIMGIINSTPDSFYDKSRTSGKEEDFLEKAAQMIEDGAHILDIGGYSSRPGAAPVSEKEELKRVIHVIKSIKDRFPDNLVSIDTFRSEVAKEAVMAGADIVNDISGGELDRQMLDTVGGLGVPYICMHMKGTPQSMQNFSDYVDMEKEIQYFFSEKINKCKKAGIKDVILDIGLGFSKTLEQNYELIKNFSYFKSIQLPVLIGVSRKSMIYKLLKISPEEALNGTTALHMAALINGANILRVHDVKEANETLKLYKQIYT
ncbi:dihydropteroate synthase [Cyclobacterium amurskyense]|uniref:Dihydropteroate synthase n=1 Tax=Cyclobacterium amurskyense TaxID=320787 RepID=A0A0H4PFL5_9BACT|nr:dihydropteroate synthase [Cyclobacterium amurskyense]AKP51865.1 Dihydropteroate synthase [Cyclobacterium amurskyense]|tara:strand:- start:3961 stop:4845 length:885 start_codon:yes stop_codon:yes gene_type:complete